jgi:glucose-6-phosphate isomerase
MASSSLWHRSQRYFLYYRDLDFSLDISRMNFPEDFFERMQPKIEKGFAVMRELEAGAIANPTEKRMVGHYPQIKVVASEVPVDDQFSLGETS